MHCLNDVELQALADGEARDAAAAAHVAGCGRCRDRVEQIRRDLAEVTAAVNTAGDMPPRVEARVRQAIVSGGRVRGATVLRAPLSAPPWRRPAAVSMLVTAAAVLLVVFAILPRFAPATLSASQVLGRSLQTLSSATGVETLEYELVADGIVRGSWRIQLAVDHERPTRYRVATIGPDGEVLAALSQDPVRQRRTQLARVDGRNYVVNVTPVPTPVLSLPQMAQALVETVITMMQATSDQKLTVVEGAIGMQYVIEIPAVTPASSATTLDLHSARAVVSAADFRIQEFEAAGTLLKQPFFVSFKLLTHRIVGTDVTGVDPFQIEAGPDDVLMEGVSADTPVDELLTTIVRALARARSF